MLNKRLLVAIALFCGTLLAFEILSFIFPTWKTIYSVGVKCVVCASISGLLLDIFGGKILKSKIDPKNKAVFITGCDSGFGYQLAKRLDLRGYKVFAGCLFPTKGGALELQNICSTRLQLLQVDVTDDDSVQTAKDFIKGNLGKSELWAIVNNAGIYKGFDIELCPLDFFRSTLEVNTIGPVRVTKAFLPLLRQSKGRVVNVNSLAGRVSNPYMAPYAMSKHASVSFTECLAQEMKRWGIHVISIEPEFFQTALTAGVKGMTENICAGRLDDDLKKHYGKQYIEESKKLVGVAFRMSSPNLDIVVNALEAAISNEHPAFVYVVCRNWFMRLLAYFGGHLPIEVLYTLNTVVIPKLLRRM